MKRREIKTFKSARSGRGQRIILAPPFLVYALFGTSILFQIPAGYVIHHISFTWGMLLNQLGTLLIPALFVIRYFRLTVHVVLPFRRVRVRYFLLSFMMMFALAVITDYLVFVTEWALPVSEKLDDVYREMMHVTGFGSYIHKFLILCILPSVCEEMFFRGFCQTGLAKYYGRTPAIFITAAMFALAHLSPWYTHLYFILGLFLGWLFAETKSLWIPILCHVINNAWTFTFHSMGWSLPVKGGFKWVNTPVLVGSLILLFISAYLWIKIKNTPNVRRTS